MPEPRVPDRGASGRDVIRDAVARVWQEELAVGEVADRDNFFGLGGHSALAVQVALRLRQILGMDVELDILYMYPEFGAIVAALAAGAGGAAGAEERELTPAEERIWFVEQLHPRTAVYHISVLYRFDGKFDPGRLRQAFATLVERHKALRTGFRKPGQAVVAGTAPAAVRFVDAAGATALTVSQMLDKEARQPFDLDRPPLIRALAVGRGEAGDWLLLTAHHLVCDGASLDLIEADLRRAYAGDELPDRPDVAVAQAVTRDLQDPDAGLEYWRRTLAGLPAEISLPYDRQRPKVLGVAGAVHREEISPQALALLERIAEEEKVSPFMAWAAASLVGLAAATGERDLTVVTPLSCRSPAQAADIGMFVNTVPLRFVLPPEATARAAVRLVRRVVAGALAHSDVPMQAMIEQLGLGGDLSRVPLGQITMTYLDDTGWRWPLSGLSASRELYPTGTTKYELTWMVTKRASGVGAVLEYNTELFSPEAAGALHAALVAGFEAAFSRPDTEISAAVAAAAAQAAAATPAPAGLAGYQPITELIARQARERPDAPAVVHGDNRISYAQLDQRAAAIAAGLRRAGAGRGDIVAIPMARGANAVLAALGALRAGCAYLALDVNLPLARTRMLIEQCRPRAAITDTAAGAESLADLVPVFGIDRLQAPGAPGERPDRPVAVTKLDPACVICTSGSTGQPKAVVLPHGAISALVPDADYLTFTPDDRVACQSNPAFDAIFMEMWGALTSGATLFVVDREVALTPRRMRAFLAEHKISIMVMATSLFHQLADFEPDAFSGMRVMFFGGETCDPKRLEKILTSRPPPRLVNIYGPTENTTATTMADVTLADVAGVVPIGRPVSGAVLHVLGTDGTPVAPGETGELYIGGAGLANGYHLAPAMTAAAFVPDPFGPPGGRLYRTGDLVRQLPDGAYMFAGRNDDQVKVRGFRVELGEVDLVVRRQDQVADVVVLSHRAPDGAEITAFVTGAAPLDGAELTRRLRQELPDQMVPAVVVLDQMPMSPNGKIDRRALADSITAPAPAATGSAGVGPAAGGGELMAGMAGLWREILAVGQVGPDDDFIALGGQSIKALRLLARVDEVFGVQLELADVLGHPTLLAVTELVRAARDGVAKGSSGA
ncbi:MAG TPA: amino acid adenylation domain-containing protein [Streptosporangiaceae bacterium]|nr:amino acid adenylation domain-containing protein [Streptosporangiaceae bacterium]